jgi:hypothetical protein
MSGADRGWCRGGAATNSLWCTWCSACTAFYADVPGARCDVANPAFCMSLCCGSRTVFVAGAFFLTRRRFTGRVCSTACRACELHLNSGVSNPRIFSCPPATLWATLRGRNGSPSSPITTATTCLCPVQRALGLPYLRHVGYLPSSCVSSCDPRCRRVQQRLRTLYRPWPLVRGTRP